MAGIGVGALISIQIVFAGLLSLIFEKTAWSNFNPLYGMLAAHGFAQGPVQALTMAKTWINSVSGQELVASALATKLAHEMMPDAKVGCMHTEYAGLSPYAISR